MDLPLVLGGANAAQLTAYTDSSLATGPKRRSIPGSMAKLHPSAGSIITKSQATQAVRLNTFDAELDAATTGFKTLQYITHLMEELHMPTHKTSHLYVDNMAMMEFIKHEGTATNRGAIHGSTSMVHTGATIHGRQSGHYAHARHGNTSQLPKKTSYR